MNSATKTCRKCGATKPIDEFYTKKSCKDGHTGRCKVCILEDQKAYTEANADAINARKRERHRRNPAPANERSRRYYQEHRQETLAYQKEYWQQEDHKEAKKISSERWRRSHPVEYAAQVALNNAIKLRRVTKPDTCSCCGTKHDWLHAHHPDYSRPFDVVWVCPSCHCAIHREEKEVVNA